MFLVDKQKGFGHHYLQMFGYELNNMSIWVLGRGSVYTTLNGWKHKPDNLAGKGLNN